MHGSQKCCSKLAELTVVDIWQIADAGDQELRRLAHSSRRGTKEFDVEDNYGLSQQAFTELYMHCAGPLRLAIRKTA